MGEVGGKEKMVRVCVETKRNDFRKIARSNFEDRRQSLAKVTHMNYSFHFVLKIWISTFSRAIGALSHGTETYKIDQKIVLNRDYFYFSTVLNYVFKSMLLSPPLPPFFTLFFLPFFLCFLFSSFGTHYLSRIDLNWCAYKAIKN